MTNETIDLIVKWFSDIEQLATDRKTQTGAVMDAQHCLNEIAAIASESKQFVEEYRYEQEPIDEEKLTKLAEESRSKTTKIDKDWFITVFKVGYHKGWENRQ